MVDRIILSFIDENRKRSNRFSDRGYSLIGKTGTLHVLNSGSTPDSSKIARKAQLVERNIEAV